MQVVQKYKKKVTVLDERSTPEARAARLKRLRNLANLSRKEMCESSDLNINTLKGWELGRYGGLSLDGAYKLVRRVAAEGVFCTVEWLLHEDGLPPRVDMQKTGSSLESSIESFAKKISHDLQSPIAALKILLTDTRKLHQEHEEFLKKLLNSLNKIADNLKNQG